MYSNKLIKGNYSISSEPGYVVIENGLAGTYKIHQDLIFVDACENAEGVLHDNSDEKPYIKVADFGASLAGGNRNIISMYPADFGVEAIGNISAKINLIYQLSLAAARQVSHICLEPRGKLKVGQVMCPPKHNNVTLCDYGVQDQHKMNVYGGYLFTSLGRIPLVYFTTDYVEMINQVNAWLVKNGYDPIGEADPSEYTMDFIFRNAPFEIYYWESCSRMIISSSCDPDTVFTLAE